MEQDMEAAKAHDVKGESLWRELVGIIDRPAAVLAGVYARPGWRWAVPLILVLLSIVVQSFVSAPYTSKMMQEQLRTQLGSLTEEQAAGVAPQMESLSSPLFMGFSASFGGLVQMLISALLASAILYFGTVILGGEGDFSSMFTMVSWTWIPFFFRNLFEAIWIRVNGSLVVNHGLSWLVSVGDPLKDAQNVWYVLLSFVEVFAIWHVILAWLGLQGGPKLNRSKATGLTAAYVILVFAANGLLIALSRAFGGLGGS